MTETLEHVEEFASQEPREESASGEAFGASAPDAQPPAESDLSAANAAVIRQMVLAAKDAGMVLTGPGGLLKQLTKMVIETALDEEMSEHLGYDKHDPAGRGSGNSRNGMRSKTVMTDNVGPVSIDVPRDRDGSFEPQLVKKRQRRLGDLDTMVLSLYAKGLTTGEISAHLGEVYGASVSKDTVSRITDRVVEEMQTWWARPLEKVYAAIFIDAIVVKVRDGQVRNRPFYAAIGVDLNGCKDVLGMWAGDGDGESAKYWMAVLTELRNRGVQDVFFVVCDGLNLDPPMGGWRGVDRRLGRRRRGGARVIARSRCRGVPRRGFSGRAACGWVVRTRRWRAGRRRGRTVGSTAPAKATRGAGAG